MISFEEGIRQVTDRVRALKGGEPLTGYDEAQLYFLQGAMMWFHKQTVANAPITPDTIREIGGAIGVLIVSCFANLVENVPELKGEFGQFVAGVAKSALSIHKAGQSRHGTIVLGTLGPDGRYVEEKPADSTLQ